MKSKPPKSSQIKIHGSDLISGHQYLKLIEDFKAYDEGRKKHVKQLMEKIEFLSTEHPERATFYRDWQSARHYKKLFKDLSDAHERLLSRSIRLELRLEALTSRINELNSKIGLYGI